MPTFIVKVNLLTFDIFDAVRHVLGVKRITALNQLTQYNSNRPYVNLFIISPSAEHLRCFVEKIPCGSKHVGLDESNDCFFTDSEVDNFELLLCPIIKNVLRLDISVANVLLVHIFQGLKNLSGDKLELLIGGDPKPLESRIRSVLHN